MPRLRIRIELNRRNSGVPLDKMASVVEETRKFLFLLSEDVHIPADRGEWVASDFDAESLNFTVEFVGPVSTEQVLSFGAAFAGATSLRRTTIAQFTRIADFLGEDELVGFGLYHNDDDAEPSEWRCLSKRDAMRFGEEIKLLAESAGEQSPEKQLTTVMNGSAAGRRLFKDRREREVLAADPSKLLRELEANLARRITVLETQVAEQTRHIADITQNPNLAEDRFQRLLTALENFWAQAPRQLPQLPAPPSGRKQRGSSMLGVVMAAIAVASGVAVPQIEQQWSRYASVEMLPIIRPKAPAPPTLAIVKPRPVVKLNATARSSEPFIGPLIPLDVPTAMRAKIRSEVRVDVIVAIDPDGNVTGARVSSTKGDRARLLVGQALHDARESHFRPARVGDKTVESKMLLTFLFRPDSDEAVDDDAAGN